MRVLSLIEVGESYIFVWIGPFGHFQQVFAVSDFRHLVVVADQTSRNSSILL